MMMKQMTNRVKQGKARWKRRNHLTVQSAVSEAQEGQVTQAEEETHAKERRKNKRERDDRVPES